MKLVLAWAFFFLNLADAASTLVGYRAGGIEVNPLMAYLLTLNPMLFVVAKVVVGSLVARLLASRLCKTWVAAFVVVLYVCVVVNNILTASVVMSAQS